MLLESQFIEIVANKAVENVMLTLQSQLETQQRFLQLERVSGKGREQCRDHLDFRPAKSKAVVEEGRWGH